MTEKRVIQKRKGEYPVLFCVIPAFFRHVFGFDKGDVLDWSLENVEGEWCIVIRSEKIRFEGI